MNIQGIFSCERLYRPVLYIIPGQRDFMILSYNAKNKTKILLKDVMVHFLKKRKRN